MKTKILITLLLLLFIVQSNVFAEERLEYNIIEGKLTYVDNTLFNKSPYARVPNHTDGKTNTGGTLGSPTGRNYFYQMFDEPFQITGYRIHAANGNIILKFYDRDLNVISEITPIDNSYSSIVEVELTAPAYAFSMQRVSSMVYVAEIEIYGSNHIVDPVTQILTKPLSMEEIEIKWDSSSILNLDYILLYKEDELIATIPKNQNQYIVKNLIANTQYKFSLVAVDEIGARSSPVVFYEKTLVKNITPPEDIKNLKSIVTNDSIKFTWDNPLDTDFHEVRIYRDGKQIGVAVTPSNYFIDFGLQEHTTYSFVFRSINLDGLVSEGVTVTETTKGKPRTQVTGLRGSELDSKIDLNFNRHSDLSVQGYYIYQNGSKIQTVTGNKATITDLINGTYYDFQVSAFNEYGESPLSSIVKLRPFIKLDTPKFTVLSKTESSIEIEWESIEHADDYIISVNDKEVGTTKTTSFNIMNLNQGQNYKVTLFAVSQYDRSFTSQFVTTVKKIVPTITSATVNKTPDNPNGRQLTYTHENGVTGVRVYINDQLIGQYPVGQVEIPLDFTPYTNDKSVKITIEPVDENGQALTKTTFVTSTGNDDVDEIVDGFGSIFDIANKGFIYLALASIILTILLIVFFWSRLKTKKLVHGAGGSGVDTNGLMLPTSKKKKYTPRPRKDYVPKPNGFKVHSKKVSYVPVGAFGMGGVKKRVHTTYERNGVLYTQKYVRGKGKVFVPKDFENRKKHVKNQFEAVKNVFTGGKRSGNKPKRFT